MRLIGRSVRASVPHPQNRERIRKMEKYKQEFIEFMVDCGVLKF